MNRPTPRPGRGKIAGQRMFAAAIPPPEAVEHLEEFLEPRRSAATFRWSPAEQFHVTLAFAPKVADRHLDDLLDRLERAARRRTPITTRLAGGGAFPTAAAARVIWAGLDLDAAGSVELSRLATGARAAFAKAGAPVDGQRFRPHLTIARLGRPDDVTPWARLLDSYAGPRFEVSELALVASYLGEGPRGRPRYETIGTWPLTDRG